LIRVSGWIALHSHFKQGPGNVQHDPRVSGAQSFRQWDRIAQPVPLPHRLGHLEGDKIRQCLGERIAVGPIGIRWASPDGRDVHGVPGFVQQLAQVV
jgi:hypothetical protein